MFWRRLGASLAIWLCLSLPVWADVEVYQTRANHDPDGIGKNHMGREIAQVMGHQGAGWLERSSRESEEQPRKVIAALKLKPDSVVADIGAGTGYFSFRIASQFHKGKCTLWMFNLRCWRFSMRKRSQMWSRF